ncbi:MAG: hypothetical protein RBS56_01105 [Candidatus Gracilibacteria bacterium]|jgi:hypothetical protein|nr:hypothetical protein [Candidatus Gracilibacteria bacterium]
MSNKPAEVSLDQKTLETLKAIEKDEKMDNYQRQFEAALNAIEIKVDSPPLRLVLRQYIKQIIETALEAASSRDEQYKILGFLQKEDLNYMNFDKLLKYFDGLQRDFLRWSIENFLALRSHVMPQYLPNYSSGNLSLRNSDRIKIKLRQVDFQTDYHIGQRIAFYRILSSLDLQEQKKLSPNLEPVHKYEDYSQNNTPNDILFSKGDELQLVDIGSGDTLWLYSPDLEDSRNQEIIKGYRETMELFEKYSDSEVLATTPEGLRSQIAGLFQGYQARLREQDDSIKQLTSEINYANKRRETTYKASEEEIESLQETLATTRKKASETELEQKATIDQLQATIDQLQARVQALETARQEALETLEKGNSFGKRGNTIERASEILNAAVEQKKLK